VLLEEFLPPIFALADFAQFPTTCGPLFPTPLGVLENEPFEVFQVFKPASAA
jgi:hypothetical protein